MILPNAERRHDIIAYWGPALTAGALAWLAYTVIGQTPIIRASGLALVVVGVGLALRRWGVLLSMVGVLAFAFSPAFWTQTGGAERLSLPAVVGAFAIAALGVALATRLTQRRALALVLGLAMFGVLFLMFVGEPRSLRLTTLLAVWIFYLLTDALWVTNPRPDEAAPTQLRLRHTVGMIVLLAVGIANDPLIVLLLPGIALGLFLSQARLPLWYWALLLVLFAAGTYGIAVNYADSGWWLYPAAQAEEIGYRVPKLFADGWRAPARWLYLGDMLVDQFTVVGLVLGVLGLSRLARWYPSLGVTTMVTFGTYFVFGLVYFGRDIAVLLIPLFAIQVFWMTYAIHAFGQWLQRGAVPPQVARWLVPATYLLLPLFLLLRVTGVI